FLRESMQAIAGLFRRLVERPREESAAEPPVFGGAADSLGKRSIRRILSTIHNNSILVCGQPGSGKTSMLLELKDRLQAGEDPTTEFYPVFVDLHGVPERLLFATAAAAVNDQVAEMPLFCRMNELADPKLEYSHRDLAKDLRKVLRLLANRRTRQPKLVLLVDGIDALNHYAPRTTQRVRSLFMAGLDGNLVMVATAVAIDKHWEQEGSPWYNFFEEIELPAFDLEKDERDRMPRDG
ncbi:MAG: AAA family ATPase, partial [Acidobacteriota bacterium]